MTFDLQRANVWKRISAFLFDVILLAIACVLCAWGLSALLGFDAQYQTLMTRYQAAADACGLDMSIMTQTYSALTDAQRALVEQANAVLAADETAIHAYGMVIQLSILIVSFGVLSGYLLLEFLVPLLFKNGQTLGKKIFGVALMRDDGVRIGHVTLFVRTVLGKYAVETMIPIMAVMMLFFGNLNIVVLGIVLILSVTQFVLFLATRKHSLIHDLLADTVAVDMASQMIFNSTDELVATKPNCKQKRSRIRRTKAPPRKSIPRGFQTILPPASKAAKACHYDDKGQRKGIL